MPLGSIDEAGTQRLRAARARLRIDAVILEELLEHLVEGRTLRQIGSDILVFDSLRGRNVDHRVGDLVDEIGEIGRPRLGGGGTSRRQRERSAKEDRSDRERARRFCRAATRRRSSQPVVQHGVSPHIRRSVRLNVTSRPRIALRVRAEQVKRVISSASIARPARSPRWNRAYQSAFAEGAGPPDGAGAVSGAGVGVEKYRKKSDFGLMSARVRPLAKLFS